MRLLTAISIASLVVSIAAVVFVLGLYAELDKLGLGTPTEHTQDLEKDATTPLLEEAEPNLTDQMLLGVLEQYHQAYKQAGYPMGGFLSGARCLRGGEMAMGNRYGDFKKSFDPKRIGREWELQVTGGYCDGIEYFYINDATGKLSR